MTTSTVSAARTGRRRRWPAATSQPAHRQPVSEQNHRHNEYLLPIPQQPHSTQPLSSHPVRMAPVPSEQTGGSFNKDFISNADGSVLRDHKGVSCVLFVSFELPNPSSRQYYFLPFSNSNRCQISIVHRILSQ